MQGAAHLLFIYLTEIKKMLDKQRKQCACQKVDKYYQNQIRTSGIVQTLQRCVWRKLNVFSLVNVKVPLEILLTG